MCKIKQRGVKYGQDAKYQLLLPGFELVTFQSNLMWTVRTLIIHQLTDSKAQQSINKVNDPESKVHSQVIPKKTQE